MDAKSVDDKAAWGILLKT